MIILNVAVKKRRPRHQPWVIEFDSFHYNLISIFRFPFQSFFYNRHHITHISEKSLKSSSLSPHPLLVVTRCNKWFKMERSVGQRDEGTPLLTYLIILWIWRTRDDENIFKVWYIIYFVTNVKRIILLIHQLTEVDRGGIRTLKNPSTRNCYILINSI